MAITDNIELNSKQYEELIKKIEEKQKNLKEGEYFKIPRFFEEILLSPSRKRSLSLKGIILSDTNFNGKYISGLDFTGSYGAKINPQTVKDKDCNEVNFCDVELLDVLDGCKIGGASFKGSTGAKIKPSTIPNRACRSINYADVTIYGSFDDCEIHGSKFEGSIGAKINPQKIKNKACENINFADVEITGSFDGCSISGSNFTGSTGAKINPQTVFQKQCEKVTFTDAEIIGSFDGCSIKGSNFTRSTGAKINPQTIVNINCCNVNFADAVVEGSFEHCRITDASFKGSKGAKIDLEKVDGSLGSADLTDAEIIVSDLDGYYDKLKKAESLYVDVSKKAKKDGITLEQYLAQIIEKRNRVFSNYIQEIEETPIVSLIKKFFSSN